MEIRRGEQSQASSQRLSDHEKSREDELVSSALALLPSTHRCFSESAVAQTNRDSQRKTPQTPLLYKHSYTPLPQSFSSATSSE